jgi:hypothetical protein
MTAIAFKLVLLLKRRPDLTPDAFSDAWLALDGSDPVAPPGLVRRVFNRPFAGEAPIANAPVSPYDAAEESWWERKWDTAEWIESREHRARWLPRRLELLAEPPSAIGGVPLLLWGPDSGIPEGTVKILVLPVARRGLTVQEFRNYWTGTHAELALGGPGTMERLVRLENTPSDSAPSIFKRTQYDGIGTIAFESADALHAEFESDYYREILAPDEPRFTNPDFSRALLATEVVLR